MLNPYELKYRKYGNEETPGGRARYIFRFGMTETGAFVLFKFRVYKPINDPPVCLVMSFDMKDFLESAKQVGLKVPMGEQAELTADLKKYERNKGE